MPLLDDLSEDAARPRRGQHRRVPRRAPARPQHRLVRLRPRLPGGAARRGRGPGGARRRRRRRGRGRLRPAATRARSTSRSSTPTATRAEACVERLAKRFGDDRVALADDLERALAEAQGVVNATPVGMHGHPGTPVPRELLRADLWVTDVVYFPLETELIAARPRARLPGAPRRRDGRAPGGRRVRATSPAGRPTRADGAALRGADRLMRKGIATVSLSGVLADKLDAIAAAPASTAIEIFDNDLIASPLSPSEVAAPLRRPGADDRPLPAGPRRRGRAPDRSTPCCTGSAPSSG